MVKVEVEVESRNYEVFKIFFKVLQFSELPIDFWHFFKEESGDVVFVFDLNVGGFTTLLKRGLSRGIPSDASCSKSRGRFLTICLLF